MSARTLAGTPLGGGATYRKWHGEGPRKAVDAGRNHTSLDEKRY